MKLTNKEYTVMCSALENRGYRYSDSEDTTSDEYKTYSNINNRIFNGETTCYRFTQEQKNYLLDMLTDYRDINCGDDSYYKEDKKQCQSIIDKLLK